MRKPQMQERLIPLTDRITSVESAMYTEFSEDWQPLTPYLLWRVQAWGWLAASL